MLKSLLLNGVGPAPKMRLEFGERLNLLTGDNGLGKSFFLDIAWWALTRKWPAEVNKELSAGLMAKPLGSGKGTIEFQFTAKGRSMGAYESTFDRRSQSWRGGSGRPANPGLVLYAQPDGSFAVWDPARNYNLRKRSEEIKERPPAYVFTARQVWDGLRDDKQDLQCNGLISDWAGWQKEKGEAFRSLVSALEALSPSPDEPIEPGELTRVSLDDPRDIPTLKMAYGQSVPVVHASAGIRRIIALAYLLVWSWQEHKKASEQLRQKTTSQVVFLIDEIEAHLHPKWQRRIVHSLFGVVASLTSPSCHVQVITATHSPLVLASVESLFNPEVDSWFDLDYANAKSGSKVVLTKREFVPHGDASNWLTSEAFDLPSSRSLEGEQLVAEAAALAKAPRVERRRIKEMHQRLLKQLNPRDAFLFRWRAVCERKGLLL